jgi:hypothetical protein
MVIIHEETSRYKELVLTLTPLAAMYAKTTASAKAVSDFVNRFASVLEKWDYSPKEIKNLDKRAFIDMVKSWAGDANASDISIIRAIV